MNEITFRKTQISDKKKVMQIYRDAREYMIKNGNSEQWSDGHPKEELIDSDIASGIGYVCEYNGEIAAVFMLDLNGDESYDKIYDGKWLNGEPYGVIHRIAVSDNMHGKGIAKACFDFCGEECKKRGIRNLKIDTHKDNFPMQKALSKYGFVHCGTVYIYGILERMAYQYEI